MQVCAVVDPVRREIHVNGLSSETRIFKSLFIKDAIWGRGCVEGEFVEAFEQEVPIRLIKGRAYFNPNRVEGYIDRTTGAPLVRTNLAALTGNCAFWA